MKSIASFFALIAASGMTHALSGQVSDASGKPIPGASIEVAGSQQNTSTNAQGRFSLDTGSAALGEVHITAPGFSHHTLHIDADQTEGLRITLKRSPIEQVDVIGLPLHLSIMESAQPVTVVSGEDLRKKQASTLGETLKNEIGVHSSYFGPVASSPIIRGMGGPRVLITQNSLDVSDVSRVGPDHVVATEATTAQQIEILRGPSTLFYGSGAIGGVVNIVDDRVPSSSESKGAFSVGHNTVADENEASFAYTGGNDNVAFHVDGFWRDGSDYDIPGIAILETEEEHEEEGHEEHREGVLEDSASESEGYNIGGSWLLDNGYVGLSYGRLERLNGVPGHAHGNDEHEGEGEEHEEHGGVLSDLEQDRWQLISELSLDDPLLSGVNTRIGYTDYQHTEIEDGVTGTTFKNETLHARVDLILQEMAGWKGALSFEGKTTDFEAIGEEAFTAPNQTDSFSVALLQEKHVGDLLWQLGGRIEKVSLKADAIEWEEHHHEEEGMEEHELLHFNDLDFTPFSLSAGLVWDFTPEYNVGVSITHAQRAPSAAELFSYGPHIATSTFEVGALFELHQEGDEVHFDYQDNVDEETSNNIDLTLRKHSGEMAWVVNAFYNQVSNFYYERNTGLTTEDFEEHDHEAMPGAEEEEHHHEHGELPVYVFEQGDVTLYGLEAQFAWQFSAAFKLTLWGDSIRGKLDNGGDLPRIPPMRLGSQLSYSNMGWNAELAATHYFEQDKIAEFETETEAYTMVDAEVAYTFNSGPADMTVYLKASNLTDEEARVHSSFLKDSAPLPGRGFSLGLRGNF